MNHSTPLTGSSSAQIEGFVLALESLTDGELAVDLLVACGKPAIGPLERFLLRGAARTISLPRCRAVRALGELEARETLVEYLENAHLPADPAVLFAEDAVRSAVARELLRWKSDETFRTLLNAAERRSTVGLIEALGEFRRSEAIPLLFQTLEDDLCRNAAFAALLKTPEESRSYIMLSLRGGTKTNLTGPSASRRRRATAELVQKLGIAKDEWKEVSGLLRDDDPAVVIPIAAIGFQVAPQEEFPDLLRRLFRIAHKLNWVQEDEVIHLLDDHKALARNVARTILAEFKSRGQSANWLSPTWRILEHLEKIEIHLPNR